MDSEQIDALINTVKDHAHNADKRCEYEVDWLDGDNLVVNCKVTKECDQYLAADSADRLAKVVSRILNAYYPRVARGEYWHVDSNANYWTHNAHGESFEVMDIDELTPGDIVQFQIYEQSYE